jgi:hypothetical protein
MARALKAVPNLSSDQLVLVKSANHYVRRQQLQPGNGRCATCDATAMIAVTAKTSAKVIAIFLTIVSPLQVMFTLLEPTGSLRDYRHILALSRAETRIAIASYLSLCSATATRQMS